MRRPVFIRWESNDAANQWSAYRAGADAQGLDGMELVIAADRRIGEQPSINPTGNMPSGTEEPRRCSLAAACTTTDVEQAAQEVVAFLDRGASMHAACLSLTLPRIVRVRGEGGFLSYQEAFNFAYEVLRRCRSSAERCGVPIALEACHGGAFLSPVELRELFHSLHSWAVGACVDVDRIQALGSPCDWLRTLRGQVHAVRLTIDTSSEGDLRVTDQGAFDELVLSMNSADYSGAVILRTCQDSAAARVAPGLIQRLRDFAASAG
jgi:hypothetical protein